MPPRARLPVIAPPTVQPMPLYVRGFPMHMALTVVLLPGTDLGERRLPRLDIHGAADIRATFTREGDGKVTKGGRDLTKALPQPSLGEADDTSIDFVELVPGEPRRMLFDGAALQADDPLEPGRYHVELTYHRVTAAPFDIDVREPTAEQTRALMQLGKLTPEWLISGPSGVQPPSIASDDPLRYLRVLHFLYTTPTSATAIDPRVLDALDDFYAPEAMLLRFELARLRSDKAAEDAAAAEIQSRFPTSLPALRELQRSSGGIALQREAHRSTLSGSSPR